MPPRFRNSSLLAAGVIFVIAVGVRLAHLGQLQSSPFLTVKLGDGRAYDAWAREIAQGDWIGREVFYQAPLYPYFLGTIYALLGDDPRVALGVQAVLGAAACVLLGLATGRMLDPASGTIAGMLLALYGPSIFYDSLFQKSALAVFLLCLLLYFASCFHAAARSRTALAMGAVLGLLILTRENSLLFLPALMAWLLMVGGRPRWVRLRNGGLLLTGTLLCLLPVAVRNAAVGGEFHLTTSQLGPNLYIGNHPGASGGYEPLIFGRGDARFERQDATELAQQALGRELTPKEVSRYWTEQALHYARSQPGDWMKLLARKSALALDADEAPDTEDLHSYADWSAPVRITSAVLHFGVVFPLAVLGVLLTGDQRRRLAPCLLLFLTYLAGLVLFYVQGRYRLLLVPLLIPLAASALVRVPRRIRDRDRVQGLAAAVGVAFLSAVLVNWSSEDKSAAQAMTYGNLGAELFEADRQIEGIRWLRWAVELQPEHAVWHLHVGHGELVLGNVDLAAASYGRAVTLEPQSSQGQFFLGIAEAVLGDFDAAVIAVGTAVALDPGDPAKHYHFALLLAAVGEMDDAQRFAANAAELSRLYAGAEVTEIAAARSASPAEDASATEDLRSALAGIYQRRAEALRTTGHLADADWMERFARAGR